MNRSKFPIKTAFLAAEAAQTSEFSPAERHKVRDLTVSTPSCGPLCHGVYRQVEWSSAGRVGKMLAKWEGYSDRKNWRD